LLRYFSQHCSLCTLSRTVEAMVHCSRLKCSGNQAAECRQSLTFTGEEEEGEEEVVTQCTMQVQRKTVADGEETKKINRSPNTLYLSRHMLQQ